MSSQRPNILWIVTDQQRADHVGFGHNNVVRTPNLDRLAENATVFDRAYVANPICMPNRCSMLTGRAPSAHGVIFNDRSLAWSANTLVRQLKNDGYSTALIGKSHLQHGLSRNSTVGNRKTPAMRDPYPSGWNTLEDQERYVSSTPAIEDFYGFEHVEFALGHGDMVTGHHFRWAVENGADPQALLTDNPGPQWPARQRSEHWWQVYQPTIDERHYSTTFVVERTIAKLEALSRGQAPWCVEASFPDPHHPFTPPGNWYYRHKPEDMPVSDSFDDPLGDAPKHLKFIRSLSPGPMYVQMFGPTREQVQASMAAEFGMIEMIDSGIGKIYAALERLGMADNTIVIFTSDHGDMFGDHGLMLKCCMHYQGCVRVPLFIALPGRSGTRTSALASSMDLAPTILDLCGVDHFSDIQGRSLVPVLDDPATRVRDNVYIEEDFPNAVTMRGNMPLSVRTLITADYRLTRYSTGEVELFNLAEDTRELTNLAAVDKTRKADLTDALAGAMIDHTNLARAE
ncbi:MAG: sulfatase-like hydrolase/transferase [Proteobacteria bacterium]|nr:sulfatase-like hydrolase/transferase [Pseudomonadota bacterium]